MFYVVKDFAKLKFIDDEIGKNIYFKPP